MKSLVGVLKDILIKVGDLYVPVDFVLLNMEEYTCTLIILRRPILATVRCHIDVKNGKLSFDVGDDHVEFKLFKASKFSSISDECHRIDVIDSLVWETMSDPDSNDPFEQCLLHDSSVKDENFELAMCAQFLEASP